MSLEVRQRQVEGITIVDMKGRLIVGQPSGLLRETITQIAAGGSINVILNLAHVEYIDSTGLGSMVICFTSLQKAGGALKLLSLTKRNIELLVLTKLATVFEIFGDEQEAINSFFPDREVKHFDILNFVQQQEKV